MEVHEAEEQENKACTEFWASKGGDNHWKWSEREVRTCQADAKKDSRQSCLEDKVSYS